MDKINTGVLLGAAGGIIGSFHASMPKPSAVASGSPEDLQMVKELHHSEIQALTGALVLGVIAGWGTGSTTPVWVAVGVAGVFIAVNEWSLRN